MCQRVQPVAVLARCVVVERDQPSLWAHFWRGRVAPSIPATAHTFPTKEREDFTCKELAAYHQFYPHKPAPTAPHAPTADCHSRPRTPRAVGHHHRAQRTRRSMQSCHERLQESGYELSRGWRQCWTGVPQVGRGWTRVETGRRGLHGKGVTNVVWVVLARVVCFT